MIYKHSGWDKFKVYSQSVGMRGEICGVYVPKGDLVNHADLQCDETIYSSSIISALSP
jgi:hypothetical protein